MQLFAIAIGLVNVTLLVIVAIAYGTRDRKVAAYNKAIDELVNKNQVLGHIAQSCERIANALEAR